MKVKLLSHVWLFTTPWTAAHKAVFSVLYNIFIWLIYFIHSRLYLSILYPYLTSPSFPLPKKNFIFNILHWLPDWALIRKLAYHMMSSIIPLNIGTFYILKNKWWTSFSFFNPIKNKHYIPEGPGDWQFFAYGGDRVKVELILTSINTRQN